MTTGNDNKTHQLKQTKSKEQYKIICYAEQKRAMTRKTRTQTRVLHWSLKQTASPPKKLSGSNVKHVRRGYTRYVYVSNPMKSIVTIATYVNEKYNVFETNANYLNCDI